MKRSQRYNWKHTAVPVMKAGGREVFIVNVQHGWLVNGTNISLLLAETKTCLLIKWSLLFNLNLSIGTARLDFLTVMCLWRWRQMVQEHWLLPPGWLHQRYHQEEVGRRIQWHQQRQVVVLLMSGLPLCVSHLTSVSHPALSPEVVCSSFQHGLALWGST